MGTVLSVSWLNDIYETLSQTLNNSEHNLATGINQLTYNSGDKINTTDMNTLITSIQNLNSNYFLSNYADAFVNNYDLNNITQKSLIQELTKTEIDSYIDSFLDICANKILTNLGATGNTNCGNTFVAASGYTDCGDNFRAASGDTFCGDTFRAASGDTFCGDTFEPASGRSNTGNAVGSGCPNQGNATDGAFRAASGNTACGNTFRSTCRGYGGNTNCTDNFTRASGNTNRGNATDGNFRVTGNATESDFTRASGCTNKDSNFTRASGCTNKDSDFTRASGFGNCGDNFRSASGNTTCATNFRPCVTVRFDFSVKIRGTTVTNTNFNG